MSKAILVLFVTSLFILVSCGGEGSGADSVTILKVYEAEEGRAILYDTKNKTGNSVVRDQESHFTILEKTGDNNWIIVEKAPAEAGSGRVETMQLIYYVPENRLIDFKALLTNPVMLGMTFQKNDGADTLLLFVGEDFIELKVPLDGLLKGEIAGLPERDQDISGTEKDESDTARGAATTENGSVILELELGEAENQVGQGAIEKWIDGGQIIYAIPSFTAYNGELYIIDAINFRILLFDYMGSPLKQIDYPESLPGRGLINARDIAVDDQYVYLLSVTDNTVYVIDKETEDIAEILDGTGTPPGKFGDLRSVQIDFDGNLLMFDANDNMLYSYKRDNMTFSLSETVQYNYPGQLVPISGGEVFKAEILSDGYSVTGSDGSPTARFVCEYQVGGVSVFATDSEENIYVRVAAEDPQAQFSGSVTASIISPDGNQLYSVSLKSWTNGPMERSVVVDPKGNFFEAFYDGVPFDDEKPATKLTIVKHK